MSTPMDKRGSPAPAAAAVAGLEDVTVPHGDPGRVPGAATLRDADPDPAAYGATLPGTPLPDGGDESAPAAGRGNGTEGGDGIAGVRGAASRWAPASDPGPVDPGTVLLDDASFGGRYEVGAVIGEGGMGQVRAVGDRRIGRRVAMKVVRAGQGSRSDARARFLREARVQGQLEHPSIVPVYEMGKTPEGAPYFTMRRVCGATLAEVVEALRAGRVDAAQRWSRRRLLTAFSSVCLTMHYAHTRGVVHRDLKPGNVMLCDFGEVYVLDWGLAKIASGAADDGAREGEADGAGSAQSGEGGSARSEQGARAPAGPAGIDAPLHESARTVDGELMGTPGYMAPEQVTGRAQDVDARADVYALGAILFELLT
ncbi:MAG TPA: serine/threonine-protein kinase, partial [Myxococcota bacterium]|nr:serine/threonine-protein kinase [Myxococcota bacterium]